MITRHHVVNSVEIDVHGNVIRVVVEQRLRRQPRSALLLRLAGDLRSGPTLRNINQRLHLILLEDVGGGGGSGRAGRGLPLRRRGCGDGDGGSVVSGEIEVREVAEEGLGRPVVGEGRVDGGAEGAQPVAPAGVGLADLRHPLAPRALPNAAVVVAHVVWATRPSLSRPRPSASRTWLGIGTAVDAGLVRSCRPARAEHNAYL
jgi:hypothetical protein